MPRHAGGCAALLLLTAALLCAQDGTGEWTLTHSAYRGPFARQVSVTSTGRLRVDHPAGHQLDAAMDGELFVRVRDAVRGAREVAATPRPVHPDAVGASLTITAGGRTREIEPTPTLLNALGRATDLALWQAIVGTWRQTGTTYCAPAAHLAPDDVDPAVEALSLHGDGTFAVRWPRPALPGDATPAMREDLRGTFRIDLPSGTVDFVPEEGLPRLRDFSGDGTLAIRGRRMLLHGVWFGTRSAPRKPDVCELAFEKQ